MFGNHDFETAKRIAEEKTKETGQKHVALPVDDGENPLWTIGRELKSISGKQFADSLKARLGKSEP